MPLCLLALVLTTHAYERPIRRIQVFEQEDNGVTQGDNSVMDDNEPKETEHKPFKIIEQEHEKLVTVVKRVSATSYCAFCI